MFEKIVRGETGATLLVHPRTGAEDERSMFIARVEGGQQPPSPDEWRTLRKAAGFSITFYGDWEFVGPRDSPVGYRATTPDAWIVSGYQDSVDTRVVVVPGRVGEVSMIPVELEDMLLRLSSWEVASDQIN